MKFKKLIWETKGNYLVSKIRITVNESIIFKIEKCISGKGNYVLYDSYNCTETYCGSAKEAKKHAQILFDIHCDKIINYICEK